jgi:hypothetical protein
MLAGSVPFKGLVVGLVVRAIGLALGPAILMAVVALVSR